jgi:catechol 2,3-dioxygenase-like lactoylglutathione lyase family enzyme
MTAKLVALGVIAAVLGCTNAKRSPLLEMANKQGDVELSRAIPIFDVRDFRAGQRYYHDVLGFHLDWDYGDPPSFGAVSRGEATFFLRQRSGANPGVWAMVFARDVDALHREIAARKAIIRVPPTDRPWNLREMEVADPDGNVIRFGTRSEH